MGRLSLKFYKTVICRVLALAMAMASGAISLKLYSFYLKPEIFGVVVGALQLLLYVPYMDGGFRTTTNREILATPERDGKLRLIRFAQTFYFRLTLLLLPLTLMIMAGYSFTPTVGHSGQPVLFFLAMGATGAFSLLGWAQIELLVGIGEQAIFFLMNALNSIAMLGTLWLSFHWGAGIWAFPLATWGGLCACFPAALWLIRKREPTVRFLSFRADPEFWDNVRARWRDSWACFRMQIFVVLLYTLDVFMVNQLCGGTAAAVFFGVARVLNLVRTVLHATGESAWPLVAQKSGTGTDHSFAAFLFRSNAWVIGGVVGALAMTLRPFLGLYMGAEWKPPQLLVVLLAARVWITVISSPTIYLLMGAGDFKTIARYFQRELIAAVILASLLGWKFGMTGVATGFLIATAFGTLTPMFNAYARSVNGSGNYLMNAWWRGALACATSCLIAWKLVPLVEKNIWGLAAVGALAAGAAVALGFAICLVRYRPARAGGNFRSRIGELVANI